MSPVMRLTFPFGKSLIQIKHHFQCEISLKVSLLFFFLVPGLTP